MRCEIEQRDRATVAFRYLRRMRQIFSHRIAERHFAVHDHVGKQKPGESFPHRADLTGVTTGKRPCVVAIALACRNIARSIRIEQADNNSDTALSRSEGSDSLVQNFPYLAVVRSRTRKRRRRPRNRKSPGEDAVREKFPSRIRAHSAPRSFELKALYCSNVVKYWLAQPYGVSKNGVPW